MFGRIMQPDSDLLFTVGRGLSSADLKVYLRHRIQRCHVRHVHLLQIQRIIVTEVAQVVIFLRLPVGVIDEQLSGVVKQLTADKKHWSTLGIARQR